MLIVMVAGLPGSGRHEAAAQLTAVLAEGGQRAALVTMGGDPAAAPLALNALADVTHHTTADGCVGCHSGQALMRTLDSIYRAEQPDVAIVELSATALPDTLRPYLDALADVPVEAVRVIVTAAACGPALAHQQGLAFLFENMIRTADAIWLPAAGGCSAAEVEALRAALASVDIAAALVTGGASEAAAALLPGAISEHSGMVD